MAEREYKISPREGIKKILDTVENIAVTDHRQLANIKLDTKIGSKNLYDTNLLMVLTPLVNGKALLEGNPGTGKTSLSCSISQRMLGLTPDEAKSSILHGHPQVTEEKMIGAPDLGKLQKDGEIDVIWTPAVYLESPLIVDEINRVPGSLQSILLDFVENGTASYMGHIHNKDVTSAFATLNYEDEGNTALLPPMQDRFDVSLYFQSAVACVASMLRKSNSLVEPVTWKKDEFESVRNQIMQIPWDTEAIAYTDLLFAELAYNSATGEIRKGEIESAENGHHDQNYLYGLRKNDVSTRFILALKKYAPAISFLRGTEAVTKEDIRSISPYCLSRKIEWKDDHLREASDNMAYLKYKKPINFIASQMAIDNFDQRYNETLKGVYAKFLDIANFGDEDSLVNFVESQDHPFFRKMQGSLTKNLREF